MAFGGGNQPRVEKKKEKSGVTKARELGGDKDKTPPLHVGDIDSTPPLHVGCTPYSWGLLLYNARATRN